MMNDNDSDFGSVVLSAIRYALPRKTNIISDHIRYARNNWDVIPAYWQELILRDCVSALRDVERGVDWAIDSLCIGGVREFVDWMRERGTKEAR